MKMSKVSLENTNHKREHQTDPITAVYMAIRDWADSHKQTEVLYDQASRMVVNKGYEIEVFHACLDEYAALDVWVLDEERNIAFVD